MRLVSVPLKEDDDKGKVRRRVLRKLKQLERHISAGSSSSEGPVRVLEGLEADSVASVSANSRYLVFLLKDGRVCRVRCCSRSDAARHKASEDILGKKRDTPFQLLSDAEYARQLQAEFDREHLVGENRVHPPPLRREDISPYIAVADPSWQEEEMFDPFVSVAGHIPSFSSSPEPILLTEHTVPEPQMSVPVQSGAPGGSRTSSGLRFGLGLPPVCTCGRGDGGGSSVGSQSGDRRGGGQWKRKEESWPEMGGLQWLVIKKVHVHMYGRYMYICMEGPCNHTLHSITKGHSPFCMLCCRNTYLH